MAEGMMIIVLGVFIMVVIFIWKGWLIVPQQNSVIIERLGKYQSTKRPGVNWIIPFVDKPRKIVWRQGQRIQGRYFAADKFKKYIDHREIPYDIPPQSVITRDNVTVNIDGLVYFQIVDPRRAVYEVTNLFQAVEKLAQTSLRALVGDMDLDETLSGRDKINVEMQRVLDQATDKWGLKVHRVEIQGIDPPQDVRESMEKQMKAERERRATVTEAEGAKRADVLYSEGEMLKLKNIAEGEKQATIARAEAEKRFLELRGEGEAAFISQVKNAVGEENLVPYLLGIKYLEKIPEMFGGENKVVVPYEAVSLMGSIRSIEHALGDLLPKEPKGNGHDRSRENENGSSHRKRADY